MGDDPARYGLDATAIAPFEAAGWIVDGRLIPPAETALRSVRGGPDPDGATARLAALLTAAPDRGQWLLSDDRRTSAAVAICGASRSLATSLAASPSLLDALDGTSEPESPDTDPHARLRTMATMGMVAIAADDLTRRIDMPTVGRRLSDLADAVVDDAVSIAADEVAGGTRVAVVALGKWGGRELNYASDIDGVFVHRGDATEARRIAERVIDLVSRRTADGLAFRFDADLRPEGRAGPLSRTLDAYRAYWDRWAETWELQAMLKARAAGGDTELGESLVETAAPFVFPDRLGAEAVRQIRAMKIRTEQLVDRDELKRGIGGIRDVEFAVQLLQLVHGRQDPLLRSATTLEALGLLGDGGYVRDGDAIELSTAYQWLRDVEHRIQLFDRRQTHELPPDPVIRERVAKAMSYVDDADATALERFEPELVDRRAAVRTIHERLFYRPLLEAFAESPSVSLDQDAVDRQLEAFGFLDEEAAKKAYIDLTAGLSRRSRLMQQLLPLMMGWLSESPDPDLGLAQLRLLVTSIPDNAVVVSAMRDNPVAAERLCQLLGTSRLLGRLVDRIPRFLPDLGDDDRLAAIPDREATIAEALDRVRVRSDTDERLAALHRMRASRVLRIAAADLVGVDEIGVPHHLSAMADALVAGALATATDRAVTEGMSPPPMVVMAMGKWGGRELDYPSDLDGLVVFDGEGAEAAAAAIRVTELLVAALERPPIDVPGVRFDLDLRPEGRKGALARSLGAYTAYYERWAETWELQAMLRGRAAAGDTDLGEAFLAAVQPFVYLDRFGPERIREVRQMKARVEQERIPPTEDPDFHMKLGRGGMSDVEWTVQLLQLRHGAANPEVRTPSTLLGVERLERHGLLSSDDATALADAYRFCARTRNRLYLRAGRVRDSLPSDPGETAALARALGYDHNPRTELREDYRRVTRRARRIVERVFYRS